MSPGSSTGPTRRCLRFSMLWVGAVIMSLSLLIRGVFILLLLGLTSWRGLWSKSFPRPDYFLISVRLFLGIIKDVVMVHRFPSFEIDEPARELRAGSRVLPLQPRVFDLLVYLAKNRGRVVPKDELLDTLWADVTVADGSLQRAVSLARAA